jgi:predicted amidohydrolase
MSKSISRRKLLRQTASTMAGAVASGVLVNDVAEATPPALPNQQIEPVRFNGNKYETVPLRQPEILAAAIQSRVRAVDGANPAPGLKANLDYMLKLIDKAQYYGGKKDLLCFHEFPITGWDKWTRKQALNIAREIPGPETEAIGKKAKEYNCYITFGTYLRDKDWPEHLINATVIINPAGQVIARHWKQRNIRLAFLGFELFTSSVYDVLDRYVEMYGWDAVIPIARTDIGNIGCSSCQWEPELFRTMAVKGVEIIVRTASGGGSQEDLKFACRTNSVYGVHINNAVSPDNPNFFEDAGAGSSAIIGPRGDIVAQANNEHEAAVIGAIPIGAFRARHKLPEINTELYAHDMAKYQSEYPPGVFSKAQPESLDSTAEFLKQRSRWPK